MIKIWSDSDILAQQVEFIAQDARQDFPVLREIVYNLRTYDDHHHIFEDNRMYLAASDLASFTRSLLVRIHERAFEDFSGFVRIHAGCGEYNGKRFLVIGDSGVGKTTLMVRLLFEGFKVHGDELAMINEFESFAFPRRFHIKEKSVPLLPQLRNFFNMNSPQISEAVERKIYAFSPSEAGFDWEITKREIAVLFHLEPHRDHETQICSCPKYLMVQKTMPKTFFSLCHDQEKIGRLCKLADRARCFAIQLGSLDSAIDRIRETLDSI